MRHRRECAQVLSVPSRESPEGLLGVPKASSTQCSVDAVSHGSDPAPGREDWCVVRAVGGLPLDSPSPGVTPCLRSVSVAYRPKQSSEIRLAPYFALPSLSLSKCLLEDSRSGAYCNRTRRVRRGLKSVVRRRPVWTCLHVSEWPGRRWFLRKLTLSSDGGRFRARTTSFLFKSVGSGCETLRIHSPNKLRPSSSGTTLCVVLGRDGFLFLFLPDTLRFYGFSS